MIKIKYYLPDQDHCRCLNHILNIVMDNKKLGKPKIAKVVKEMLKVSNYPSVNNLFAEALRQETSKQHKKELTQI